MTRILNGIEYVTDPAVVTLLGGVTSPDASIGGQVMRWTYDATQHDLLRQIISQLDRMNRQLEMITGEEIYNGDLVESERDL